MKVYTKTLQVTEADLDDLDHVNNVVYVQWIQDISKEHWQTVASEALKNEVIWVVSNHNITYKSAAKLHDVIEIKTFISDTKGPLSVRMVQMFLKESGVLLLEAKTKWCMLNTQTLKPTRISKDIEEIFVESNS